MKSLKQLINIYGPTASGKTNLSIELAVTLKKNGFNTEIINFDSLLFYKELFIGTARPTKTEMKDVPHHLVGVQSITTPVNSSDFVSMAGPILEELWAKKKIPILVGGSGFYIRALLKGMYSTEPASELSEEKKALFKRMLEENDKKDNKILINFLKKNDPESLLYIHSNDFYRLSRAVDFFIVNNKKMSDQKKELDKKNPYDFSSNLNIDCETHNFYLLPPKSEHLEIINLRTRKMLKEGLIEEVKNLLKKGFNKNLKPLQSIGYKETIDFIELKKLDKEDLIERINISTRQLAKAQKTFFKKVIQSTELNPLEPKQENISNIIQSLKL